MYFPRAPGGIPDVDKVPPVQAAKGGKETILMVEDDASILTIGKTMLEKLGYTVLTAEGPKKALQISKAYAKPIHLLLTDVVMPEMNGKELASRLRSDLPDLKCLYMSGYTADIIAHRGVLEGGVNFIQKPFSRKELDDKIRKILDSE
jgi:CheY-like chemotaxis protein